MAFNQAKVLASRDYKVYVVDWDNDNAIPADTVLYGTTWGTVGTMPAPWVESGYVDGGLHFTSSVDRAEIRVDQELDPVLRPATGRDVRMSTNLAEFSPTNILDATGQGAITTVAAGVGTRGHSDWDLNSTIAENYISLGFDIQHNGDDEAVRVIGWKGQVMGSPTLDFTADNKAMIPLEVQLLPDTTVTPARIAKIRDIEPMLP